MEGLVLELNDAALTWVRDGSVLASEPGFALLNGAHVITGSDAVKQAHLEPRLCRNRYWDELSTKVDNVGKSYAELAYLQLARMVDDLSLSGSDVLLVTPGHYDRTQLGLVLGIAQECGVNAKGLLHGPAVASTRRWIDRQLIHIDIGLHRISIAAMNQSEVVQAGREEYLQNSGLVAMMDRWAQRVSELFVMATRFDPSHHAESEQRLFDALPAWIAQLESQDQLNIELDGHGLVLERSQFVSALDDYFGALAQIVTAMKPSGMDAVLQLSDRLAGVPGVAEFLGGLEGCEVVRLPRDHTALAAEAAYPHIGGGEGGVRLTRQLPWRNESERAPDVAAPRTQLAERGATHLLYAGVVHPILDQLVIGRAPGSHRARLRLDGDLDGVSAEHCEAEKRGDGLWLRDLSRYGTTVNEQRVAGEVRLKPGDEVRVGNHTLVAVTLADPNET